jgi:hypothetical protein
MGDHGPGNSSDRRATQSARREDELQVVGLGGFKVPRRSSQDDCDRHDTDERSAPRLADAAPCGNDLIHRGLKDMGVLSHELMAANAPRQAAPMTNTVARPPSVSPEAWLVARKALQAHEPDKREASL